MGDWCYQEGQQILLWLVGQPIKAKVIEANPVADRLGYRPRGSLTSTSPTRQVALTYQFLGADRVRQGTTIVDAEVAGLKTLTDQGTSRSIIACFLPLAPSIHDVSRPLREDLFMVPVFGLACLGFGITLLRHHRKATNT